MQHLSKIIISFFLLLFSANSFAQYFTIKGRQLYDPSGQPFYPILCNYIVELAFTPGPAFTPATPNAVYTTPAPYIKYGPNGPAAFETFECSDWPTCSLSIVDDLTKIQSMGFNMIRPAFTPVWNSTLQKFTLGGHEFGLTNNNVSGVFVAFDQLTNTDPNIINYFAYLDFIVTQAGLLGMYTMINGLLGNVADPVANTQYHIFLQLLGNHFKNNSNIACYDILNEPAFQYTELPKADACNLLSGWYDELKSADQHHHLITGGSTTLEETLHFDLGLMKLDFNQPHFYTNVHAFDNYDYTNQLNRIKGMMYWVNRNCPSPWMNGETGYRAVSGVTPPAVDGTLSDQTNYVIASLDATRNYNGIGYSWWDYQDSSWPPPADGFGLLEIFKDIHSAADDPDEKPCVSVLQNYLDPFTHQPPAPVPSQNVEPPNYRDPYLHAVYSPNTNIIHGHVQDDFNNPIEDAYLFAWTLQYIDLTDPLHPLSYYYTHYTFTDVNGNFTLIPYDYEPTRLPNLNTIEDYEVSAIGVSRDERGWAVGPVVDNDNFTLNKVHFNYDGFISNKTVSTIDYEKNLQGWNTLTTENVTIQSGVTSEIKARNEVHLLPGFDANYGSEVHIYNTETFADCDAITNGNMRIANPSSAYQTVSNSLRENEIEVQFALPKNDFNFSVAPNPSHDKFTVTITNNENSVFEISLTDVVGNILKKDIENNVTFTLDATRLAKGVYYLKINSKTQRLIIL